MSGSRAGARGCATTWRCPTRASRFVQHKRIVAALRDPDLFITKFVFYLDEVGADSHSLNAIPGNLFPAYGQAVLGYVSDPGDSPGRRKQVRALLQP